MKLLKELRISNETGYIRRLKKVSKLKLNGGNLVQGFDIWVVRLWLVRYLAVMSM